MERNIRKLAEKYFRGECTTEEVELILAWFDTTEGQGYLNKRLDGDLNQIIEVPDPATYDKVPTSRIKSRLDRARKRDADKRAVSTKMEKTHSRYSTIFATAASLVLLIAASFLLYHYSSQSSDKVKSKQQPIVYSAGAEEHKDLSLSDGSSVRLNNNSRLIIPEVFTEDKREVTLKGEAYFEIQPNPEKPFIVNTDHAAIRVLGTSFNVKASSKAQNVQVTVKEGKVAFQEKKPSDQQVVLTKNQLGYLDVGKKEIKVEQVSVNNYLSWMTRRLVFNNTPFLRVCTQLERIYDVNCSIRDEQLTQIHFTANFERESLEKTLEIISNSLEISYQMEGNSVTWMKEQESVNG